MSGFGIGVHVDIGAPGHTWIEVFRPDGSSEQWGYSSRDHEASGPGDLDREELKNRDRDWSSPTYEITEAQYNDIYVASRLPGSTGIGDRSELAVVMSDGCPAKRRGNIRLSG